ncbi:unnamed protein product, partial [Ectocarpus sp. 12 AP-2014]
LSLFIHVAVSNNAQRVKTQRPKKNAAYRRAVTAVVFTSLTNEENETFPFRSHTSLVHLQPYIRMYACAPDYVKKEQTEKNSSSYTQYACPNYEGELYSS